MQKSTTQYIKELKSILAEPLCLKNEPIYIDLGIIRNIDSDLLAKDENYLPPNDPLIHILAILLETMQSGPFEYTRLGVNELLKSYLRKVNSENEEACTFCYFECIYQLSLYGLLDEYPYTYLFWDYLSQSLYTVSKYLIRHKLVNACGVFLSKVSLMGKDAAQKSLHTGPIQHLLHSIELWARTEEKYDLADNAKNSRFNLETI